MSCVSLATRASNGQAATTKAGTALSTIRFTKDELAPFSSNLRTKFGQQVAMGADGGVDAAARPLGGQDDVVQGLSHAVETLEFERPGRQPLGHLQHGSDRVGVVRGELR